MATPPLKLTRNQLAAFLKDHESIKAFENLFSLTENIAPDAVQDALVAAESASASASQAQALALQASNDALATAAVAEARANVALQTANDARTLAEMASLAPMFVMPPGSLGRYGQFFDTTTQAAAAANTAYPITYDTISQSCGMRLQAASRIQVNEAGIYNFQFSIQLDKTSGGTARFWIWFRVNGADVPNSASEVHIQGNNHEIFTAANLLLPLWANDYVELMWSTSDTSVQLISRAAAAPVPGVPCIIVTVTNVVSPACGVAQPTPVDPFFANVSLLLHCNGENNSTTIIDNSLSPKTVTVVAGARLTTDQARFGSGSATFDGTGQASSATTQAALSFESDASVAFGTENFTIEGFARLTEAPPSFASLIDFRPLNTNGAFPLVYITPARQLAYFAQTAQQIVGGLVTLNAWTHFALTRSAGVTRLWLEGAQVGSDYADTNNYSAGTTVRIGASSDRPTAGGFNGQLDEIRITKGVARYTASFTPPTAPFPDVGP
jgi:hypothetical protein